MAARCRNPGFLKAVGVVSGLAAVYCSWVFFEFALLNRGDAALSVKDLFVLFTSPAVVWSIAQRLNAEGWFTLETWTPSGIALWAAWAVEAAIIVEMAIRYAPKEIADQVFCEKCGSWCQASFFPLGLEASTDPMLLEGVSNGDLTALESLPPAVDVRYPMLSLETRHCAGCDETLTYQLRLLQDVVDKKGNSEQQVEDLTGRLIFPIEQSAKLRALEERCALQTEVQTSDAPDETPSERERPVENPGLLAHN